MSDQKAGAPWIWMAGAVFAALWIVLVRHLAVHWSANPQYSFGWLVPFLVGYLLHRRWADRPTAGPASPLVWWFLTPVAVAFFPTWMVEQPNPDWRLVSWTLTLEIVILSCGAAYWMGGMPWLKHFGFTIGLMLAAVPWPTGVERLIIPALTNCVAASTVEILNFCGVPALQRGNLIEVATGVLGIDEACSGVRSFQATFMVSLFLGELYRLSWQRRVFLLVTGCIVALACNIARATFLPWQAARNGLDAVAKYHDPAGFTILIACFLLVWALAIRLEPARPRSIPSNSNPHPLPIQLLGSLTAWIAFTLLATEVWYRAHEGTEKQRWDFAWPTENGTFRKEPIAEAATKLLRYDRGQAGTWSTGNRTWSAFFFKWNAGPARSRILARSHRPDICLPAGGFTLDRDHGTITVEAAGLAIPFRAFTFSASGRPVHVFYCVWEDAGKESPAHESRLGWNRFTGLDSVLRGERNLGQQVLELVLIGFPDYAEAEAALRAELPRLVRATGNAI